MMHRAWSRIKDVSHCLKATRDKKKHRFWPELGVSGLYIQFEFTDGYDIMYKDWSGIEEVTYSVSRASVNFQGHTGL